MAEYRDYGPQDDPAQNVGDAQFSGVNNRLAPDQLGPGMIADGLNVRLRTGQPETRLGVVKPGWLNNVDPVAKTTKSSGTFQGAGTFKDPNGNEWVIEIAEGIAYRCSPSNMRAPLSMPFPGMKLVGTCVPVQAFNQVFLFRGRYLQPLLMSDINAGFVDILPRWDATTVWQAAVLAAGTPAQEVAYGPFIPLGGSGSLTSVGQTATLVTTVEHGFTTGMDVVVKGAATAAYNGRFSITVLDVNTFTYPFAGGGAAGGTPLVSNMRNYWKALGTQWTPTNITSVGLLATANIVGHGFPNGTTVTVSGSSDVHYNGSWVVSNSLTNSFDYSMAVLPSASPAAGGTSLRVVGSIVLAGQSPDANPEAWLQDYTVIPNADDAIFTDNRLLIPTAYTPGSTNYDSTSAYTKKDFIVAMDIGDSVHFFFTNELRINQGSADEIVSLVTFDADTVVVLKSASWGILTGLAGGDLSQVRLDMRQGGYGTCAPRAGINAGKNVIFPTTQRGLSSLSQNQQGQTRSADVPFSNDFEGLIKRIDWTLGDKIRMAWWEDKLYVACPLLDFKAPPPNLVPAGAGYDQVFTPLLLTPLSSFYTLPMTALVPGQVYQYTPGSASESLGVIVSLFVGYTLKKAGTFVCPPAPGGLVMWNSTALGPTGPYIPIPIKATITTPWAANANNAILVYDFRRPGPGSPFTYDYQSGQWDGYDTGAALCVKEFFTANYNGKLRLFFIGEDGWANMIEEAAGYDQVGDDAAGNLAWTKITSSIDTRGYNDGQYGTNKFRGMEAVLGLWGATISAYTLTGQAGQVNPVRTNVSFSRTQYLRPVGRADYVEGNLNGDFARSGRGDYSVRLLAGGVTPGYTLGQFQEVVVRSSTRPTLGRYLQLRLVCAEGRMRVKELNEAMATGVRRDGILI